MNLIIQTFQSLPPGRSGSKSSNTKESVIPTPSGISSPSTFVSGCAAITRISSVSLSITMSTKFCCVAELRAFHSAAVKSCNGILIVNEQGTLEFANHRVETMFGYSAGELNNHSYESLIPDDKLDAVSKPEKCCWNFATSKYETALRPHWSRSEVWRKHETSFWRPWTGPFDCPESGCDAQGNGNGVQSWRRERLCLHGNSTQSRKRPFAR